MGITSLVVILGIGYLFALRPLQAKADDLDDQIAEAKKQWTSTKDQFIRSKQIRAEFERRKEGLALEGTEQDKKERINQELTKLLEDTQIVPRARSENNPERIDDDFKVYSFSLKNIGTDWGTLASFLYQIETNPAVLEVKTLTVRRSPGGTDNKAQIVADIDITRLIEQKITRTKEKKGRKR